MRRHSTVFFSALAGALVVIVLFAGYSALTGNRKSPQGGNVSYEYSHPKDAVGEALIQLGMNRNAGTEHLMDNANILPFMFHLSSADVGNFNTNTNEFYTWLVAWMSENLDTWHSHFLQQVSTVLYESNSQAASVLRKMATKDGLDVYWDYVLWPATYDSWGPIGMAELHARFNSVKSRYLVEMSNDPRYMPDFGEYLGEDSEIQQWFPRSIGASG